MNIHVLPGDAYIEEFRLTGIEGDVIVCREALIDGDVRANSLDEFWNVREAYLSATYPDVPSDYRERVASELGKLLDLPAGSDVSLWFEYELFCHVNMWFTLWLLRDTKSDVYRVEPIVVKDGDKWNGFGRFDAEQLNECYAARMPFTSQDLQLGSDLWVAYQNRDYKKLQELSSIESPCFPFLREACEAEIQKATRPVEVLRQLQDEGLEDFGEMFAGFRERAGVYGYGDDQVRRLLADIPS